MAANATATHTELENEWNDPVVEDTVLTPLVKGVFWSGFGLLVVARIAIGITSLVLWNKIVNAIQANARSNYDPNGILSTQSTQQVFLFVDSIAALVFAAGFVLAALLSSRMAAWARVTFLSVAGLLLVGSNALAAFGISGLVNALNTLGR